MDKVYYYTYDANSKSIVVKCLEGGIGPKSKDPEDIIIGMEFYSPEKEYAELYAGRCNSKLLKAIGDFESADEDALYIEKCKDCGRYFVINKEEYTWFKTRDLVLPKRCKFCREKRKNNKENK